MACVCLDRAFGIVDTVVARGDELIVKLLVLEVFDHGGGDFIIKSNHFSGESIVREYGITGLECMDKVTGPARLDGDCMNIIAIKIIHYKDVFVAPGRCNRVSPR